MKAKWIPCEDLDSTETPPGIIPLSTLKDGDVGFHTCWGMGQIIAYMIIPTFREDPTGWKSEFRGDDPPDDKGPYIVTVEAKTPGKYWVTEAWYDPKKGRWCREKGSPEVLAYTKMPKAYKPKEVA